jgi:hypothetical protein
MKCIHICVCARKSFAFKHACEVCFPQIGLEPGLLGALADNQEAKIGPRRRVIHSIDPSVSVRLIVPP